MQYGHVNAANVYVIAIHPGVSMYEDDHLFASINLT